MIARTSPNNPNTIQQDFRLPANSCFSETTGISDVRVCFSTSSNVAANPRNKREQENKKNSQLAEDLNWLLMAENLRTLMRRCAALHLIYLKFQHGEKKFNVKVPQ